jgi:hypothetical protein
MIRSSKLEALHRLTIHNRTKIESVDRCACFYCKKYFAPSEIEEWVDGAEDTAVCPFCGIDSVLPEEQAEPLEIGVIDAMHTYWFERSIRMPYRNSIWYRIRRWIEPLLRRLAWDWGRRRAA